MWKAIEELLDDRQKEGYNSGREEGRNDSWAEAVNNLMKTMDWPLEKAMNALDLPEDVREKYQA